MPFCLPAGRLTTRHGLRKAPVGRDVGTYQRKSLGLDEIERRRV